MNFHYSTVMQFKSIFITVLKMAHLINRIKDHFTKGIEYISRCKQTIHCIGRILNTTFMWTYVRKTYKVLCTMTQNYFTNPYRPTCFDIILSSSGSLLSIPCHVTQVFKMQLLVIEGC
jgi:hypothetical protein